MVGMIHHNILELHIYEGLAKERAVSVHLWIHFPSFIPVVNYKAETPCKWLRSEYFKSPRMENYYPGCQLFTHWNHV